MPPTPECPPLSELLDGSAASRADLQAHVATCPRCTALLRAAEPRGYHSTRSAPQLHGLLAKAATVAAASAWPGPRRGTVWTVRTPDPARRALAVLKGPTRLGWQAIALAPSNEGGPWSPGIGVGFPLAVHRTWPGELLLEQLELPLGSATIDVLPEAEADAGIAEDDRALWQLTVAPAPELAGTRTFGELLAAARRRGNASTADVAARVGLTPQTLHAMEAGEADLLREVPPDRLGNLLHRLWVPLGAELRRRLGEVLAFGPHAGGLAPQHRTRSRDAAHLSGASYVERVEASAGSAALNS